ncbi:hypothetical protein ACFVYR_31750 [Streptomyces sp. NPDC058284]|uniref:hypothetical protein n=1 Tax=unclassified Streptomyces TaxID=2593676 RepID=UPI0036523000
MNSKATDIVAMLMATLNTPPSQNRTGGRIRIEAELPASLADPDRLRLLRLLVETGEQFGHSIHKDGTETIWAEVDLVSEP